MVGVIVDCPTHGIQATQNLFAGGGFKVNFKGSTSNCPLCGQAASIIDARYEIDADGSARARLTPTPAQLRRLQTAFEWAQEALARDDDEPDAVQRKLRKALDKEAPKLAAIVDAALGDKSGSLGTWISVVLTLIALIVSSNQMGITEEQIAEIVRQVEDSREDGDEPAPMDTPAPDTVE